MFYVGGSLGKVHGYGVEPAMINPNLLIRADGNGDDMPYWPSYSDISPASRGAYLRWLAAGRRDPQANLGLVFLFFYGLERRALAEKNQVSETEWDEIRTEVERLVGIYGQSQSFRRYATAFLGILSSTTIDGETLAARTPAVTKPYQSANLPLRTGLGWMADKGRPIPANWALSWVRSHEGFFDRTPVTRCRDQFEQLFAVRYGEQFGDGVVVRPNKTPIKASYKPASASFSEEVNVTIPALPDITVLRQPIEKLILLANGCIDELDPFSRFLGRSPESAESPAALALLPAALVQHGRHPALAAISAWAKGLVFTNDLAIATYTQLRDIWSSLPAADVSKRDALMISQCFQRLGYGIEPDIRFSSHQLKAGGKVVLFALPEDAPLAPSAPYTSATLLAHLGAFMAHADAQVTPEEEQALMTHAAENLDLNSAERLRLQAYMKWLLATPPEMSGLKKRMESLGAAQRNLFAAFLARMVSLDGVIAPAEITALQKLYRQFGLDPKDVFTDTHSAAVAPEPPTATPLAPEPVVATAKGGGRKARVSLERVRAMEIESEQVSVLLRDIFTSDDGEVVTVASAVSENLVVVRMRVLDLDESHSRLTLSLIERDSWNRADFAALATEYRLMPEGAMDAINEAALNLHGEPLLEGDDPIAVNSDLRSVIKS